nr:hypothetical protein [Tanacetum cinerariifolium]
MQTQTSNTLHNAIMEAGSKDRPPMLAPGNYVQWKSRIKRYIDTKPNHELIHYCLTNPPYKLGWIDKEVSISEGSPITRTERNRGKVIVNSPQPIYDQEPSMLAKDDETSKDKEIDKLMALISLSFKKIYKPTNNNLQTSSNTSRANQDNSPRINRSAGYEHQRICNVARARETVGSTVVQKSGIQCYNCKEFGHITRECQKLKWVKDAAYHREKMLLCKQEEAGIQVFNKRTRVIGETIHVNFDKLPHMASDHVNSNPVPECQRMALEHGSLSPGPQCQESVTHADKTVTTSNELDLLFSLMFDELLNGSSKVVLKSSAVPTVDAHNQRQQHTTPLNTHIIPAHTCQVPTQAPTVASTENMNQAELVEEYAQVENDEFINIFCTPVYDKGETSSRHVDSSNMHTFYQHHPSEHHWTKDHPLEQVIGNPSQSVRTRYQLESDG